MSLGRQIQIARVTQGLETAGPAPGYWPVAEAPVAHRERQGRAWSQCPPSALPRPGGECRLLAGTAISTPGSAARMNAPGETHMDEDLLEAYSHVGEAGRPMC
jgi:hypothetical protein